MRASLLNILLLGLVIVFVYRSYFSPLRTYKQYRKRAERYSWLRNKR